MTTRTTERPNPAGNILDQAIESDRGTVSRRRLLAGRPGVVPSSRAIVGALLCMLAALLTFGAFQQANRPPQTAFAVAARDLAPGETLTSEDIEFVALDLPTAQRVQAVEASDQLGGTTVLGPISKGELLQRGLLVRRGTNDQRVSFRVDSAYALAGRLRPGALVSIYASGLPGASGSDDSMKLVARNVPVLRVDMVDDSTDGKVVLTVAVPPTADQRELVAATVASKIVIVDEGSTDPLGSPASSRVGPTEPPAKALSPVSVP
jgi:Flp pilus assembly protein CpaB